MQLGLGAEGEGPGAQRGSWTGQAPGQGLTMGAEPPLPQLPKVSPQHAQSQALAPHPQPPAPAASLLPPAAGLGKLRFHSASLAPPEPLPTSAPSP